jgi:hypothetical protein
LFGLIYWILFEDKDIDIFNNKLQTKMENRINENKNDNPNTLTSTRERLKESIEIYEELIK